MQQEHQPVVQGSKKSWLRTRVENPPGLQPVENLHPDASVPDPRALPLVHGSSNVPLSTFGVA